MATEYKKECLTVVNWLVDTFPQAFFKQYAAIKPLKIGIFDDIADLYERLDSPGFSKKALKQGLNFYSSSKAYLMHQEAGVYRIDLWGNEVEVVTEPQALYAKGRYQQLYNKS